MGERKRNAGPEVLIVSIALMLYFLFLVVPFADKHRFYSENSLPEIGVRIRFFAMSTPVFAAYVVYVCIRFTRIIFLKTILYPALVANLYFGAFTCMLIMGGAIMWLMVLTILFLGGLFAFSIYLGFHKDREYLCQLKEKKHSD